MTRVETLDQTLPTRLRLKALEAGFQSAGVVRVADMPDLADRMSEFVARGRHGDMHWFEQRLSARGHPSALWREARSVVMLGMNYGPPGDPLAAVRQPERGAISVYAGGKDYHVVVKRRLKQVAGWLQGQVGGEVKVFVDTAPVAEKPLARAAGLGWQGKHTNLVSREYGSWLFLGAIFSTRALAADRPQRDHCGNCRQCLDICPTRAFPAPYQLDARRCISYLTIEHRGHIAMEFRQAMGNRIFGCDDCLAVCPWNKFAKQAAEQRFHARPACDRPLLAELVGLDEAAFRSRFQGTPVKRAGHAGFLRNVLIACGNSGDRSLIEPVRPRLDDASPVVRAMAVWALSQLLEPEAFGVLKKTGLMEETDPAVRREWEGPG